MSFPEVYWCVFALSCLLFTCLDIIPLVIRFGPELLRIVLFFFTFPQHSINLVATPCGTLPLVIFRPCSTLAKGYLK